MNAKQKLKFQRISVFLLMIALACLAYGYQDQVKLIIKAFLESNWSVAIVSIYSTAAVVIHRMYIGEDTTKAGFAYAQFGKFADSLLAIFTYILSSATSLALLKGIYLQTIFSQTYFVGFNALDFGSIVIVSSFLLYYCLLNTTKLIIEVVSQVDAQDVS